MATVVNGERIHPGEIEAEVDRLRPQYKAYVEANDESGESGEEQLREWATENVVERALVRQAARDLDVEIPPDDVDQAFEEMKDRLSDEADEADVKSDIELQMRVDRLMAQGVEAVPEPTDEELRAFYEEHAEELRSPEQVRASHIVKNIDGFTDHKKAYEAVLNLKMRIEGGEKFEDLAREHSDCPENAGFLGTFPRGQMVPEFEEVIFQMQPGEVSDVFLTQFGYHIAKLHERIPAQPVPLEQVREQIAEHLTDQRRGGAVEAFVDSLKAEAAIEDVPDEPAEAPESGDAAEPAEPSE